MAQTTTHQTMSNAEAHEWLDQQWQAMTQGEQLELPDAWDPCLLLDELNKVLEEPLPITCDQFETYLELHPELVTVH